jgi:hypothetical protein
MDYLWARRAKFIQYERLGTKPEVFPPGTIDDLRNMMVEMTRQSSTNEA